MAKTAMPSTATSTSFATSPKESSPHVGSIPIISQNPEEFSPNIVSTVFMSWLNDYIQTGYKQRLEISDAMPLHSRDVPSRNYADFIAAYNVECTVWKAMKSVYWKRFILSVLLCALGSILSLSGPLLLREILTFVQDTAAADD
jgi:hypothetical protein